MKILAFIILYIVIKKFESSKKKSNKTLLENIKPKRKKSSKKEKNQNDKTILEKSTATKKLEEKENCEIKVHNFEDREKEILEQKPIKIADNIVEDIIFSEILGKPKCKK